VLLDLPAVGVTDRPLLATGPAPGTERGDTAVLDIGGEDGARWVRTATGVRPLVAHAAWRTTPELAVDLVLATTHRVRTPEPLRAARHLLRRG
jgi:deoxyribonuclease V